jgi:hypothetical protein
MPRDDPTRPWEPPRQPTPQPVTLREWIALLKLIVKAWRETPRRGEYPTCRRCGGPLEVTHFRGHEPVWGCPQCG